VLCFFGLLKKQGTGGPNTVLKVPVREKSWGEERLSRTLGITANAPIESPK